MRRMWVYAVTALLLATPAAGQSGLDCQRCHGELELVRQYVGSLEEARAMVVPARVLDTSGHAGMTCAECHTGFARFPHEPVGETRSCASCHEDQEDAWMGSTHALNDAGESVACSQCHGVHDVAPAAALEEGPALEAMSGRCASCHETQRLPAEAHHQGHAGCHDCHDPHGTLPPDDSASWMAPAQQPRVCGACHDSVTAVWAGSAHQEALAAGEWQPETGPPTCSSCHGGHPVLGADDAGLGAISIQACAGCHEHAADTYYGTYHGKAARLGSAAAATCAECHGAHEMLAADNPASRVHADNLVATCGECHEHARPAFVKYDSHPEPMNRDRNPVIFYSFWFMNTLLIGTLGVFGLHTLLWWVRVMIDRRKGIVHHGHGGGGGE